MSKRSLVFCSIALVCASGVRGRVRAQHSPGEDAALGARAHSAAPVAATNHEDATAAGTRIDVRSRERALESVAEVVREAPGARVRSTGGFGAFSGVALRGAGVEHTTVLFGDLPLNTADTGAFDLSLVPLEVLDGVEVYRGGAPVWWSDGAIGGVVRLLPRSASQTSLGAHAGFGSFGRFELGASTSVVSAHGARPSLFSHVSYARADNDYRYVDDMGTLFDTVDRRATDDDVIKEQGNAQVDAGNALAHAAVDVASGRLDVVLHGHARTEGVPGPLAAATSHTHRQLVRVLGAASWTKESLDARGERRYRVQLLASANRQQNRVSDVGGQVGVSQPRATDDAWDRGYARAAASLALTPFLEPTVVLSAARDDFRPADALAFSNPPRPSGRTTEAAAVELRAHGNVDATRLELRGSARGQWTQSSIWVDVMGEEPARERRDESMATYRLSGVIAPWRPLAFSASVSTGARVPSLLELFGDRALQQANPELRSERSRSADVSVVAKGRLAELRGSVELRGFATWLDDMIAYRRTAQLTVTPENIDSGRILGVELGARGSYGRHVSLVGSATAMQTRNQFGASLPLRPSLQASLRPELTFAPPFADGAAIFTEVEHVSFVYLDPPNRTVLDGRTVLSLGGTLRFWNSRMLLAARAQNVLDAHATDVLSRPLPGFNVLVSLAVEQSL